MLAARHTPKLTTSLHWIGIPASQPLPSPLLLHTQSCQPLPLPPLTPSNTRLPSINNPKNKNIVAVDMNNDSTWFLQRRFHIFPYFLFFSTSFMFSCFYAEVGVSASACMWKGLLERKKLTQNTPFSKSDECAEHLVWKYVGNCVTLMIFTCVDGCSSSKTKVGVNGAKAEIAICFRIFPEKLTGILWNRFRTKDWGFTWRNGFLCLRLRSFK